MEYGILREGEKWFITIRWRGDDDDVLKRGPFLNEGEAVAFKKGFDEGLYCHT